MNLPRPSYVPCRSRTVHSEILNNEVCLYEWTRKRVHALNATAARVWTLCDGTRSVAEIAETLGGDLGMYANDVVALAVAQFGEAGLLDGEVPAEAVVPSRRTALKRLGLTAAMLPVVSSIAAPSALEAASLNSQVFNFTGASQSFVVPAGVTQITVDALGAWGGGLGAGGWGGEVIATIPVTAGDTLTVNVGGAGLGIPGGFNGGGQGGSGAPSLPGGGGGGASDVRRGSTRLVVAGGGGGGAVPTGGAGGGTTGGSGKGSPTSTPGGGGGGSQTAGGSGGAAGSGGTAGTAGSLEVGGNGGSGSGAYPWGGGGGGGGYFGGGGGGGSNTAPGAPDIPFGGGGGGSSYTDPAATNVTHRQGVGVGNGKVTISW